MVVGLEDDMGGEDGESTEEVQTDKCTDRDVQEQGAVDQAGQLFSVTLFPIVEKTRYEIF